MGENPHKVQNIVDGQLHAFREKYAPVLESFANLNTLSDGELEQDMSLRGRGSLISDLPKYFKPVLVNNYLWTLSKEDKRFIPRDEPTFSQQMATHPLIGQCVENSRF
jgi:hypothetical protein